MGSSRSRAGVSGGLVASALSYGIESSFCKAAMARSGSPNEMLGIDRWQAHREWLVVGLLQRCHKIRLALDC
jgi:hypothetical protein